MRLMTTPHAQFWNLDETPVALLGPGCLTDKTRDLLTGKNYIVIESPWKNQRIHDKVGYCFELMRRLLSSLTAVLNEVHQVDYSDRYWRVIVSWWLYDHISYVYDKYLHLQQAISYMIDCETYFTEPEYRIPVFNLPHHLSFIDDDDFHLYMYSLIGRELGMRHRTVSLPPRDYLAEIRRAMLAHRPDASGLSKKIKKLAISLCEMLLVGKNPSLLIEGLSEYDKLRLSLATGLRFNSLQPWREMERIIYQRHEAATIDRAVLNRLPARDQFEDILRKTIVRCFPISYLEMYSSIVKQLRRSFSNYPRIIIGANWYYYEAFKFISADTARHGGKLIGLQFGGAAGLVHNFIEEMINRHTTDIYISSGWEEPQDFDKELCPTVPLPKPFYNRLNNTHRPGANICIFVGNIITRYVYRVQSFYVPDDMKEYFERKYDFIDHLTPSVRDHFTYRPFPYDWGWHESERMSQRYPAMPLLTGGDLVRHMQSARVVVHDHLATSYLESLVINVPTVILWDEKIFPLRPSALPYFSRLAEAGIVYTDPAAAATQVNLVFADVFSWWNSVPVQTARKEFVRHMGWSDKNWISLWGNFIKKQLGAEAINQ